MGPFRDGMEDLGFTDVQSYGTTGNLLFNASATDLRALERRVAAHFDTDAFVRTRSEMARVVTKDPLGAIVMFLGRPPSAARRRAFLELDFQEPRPVLRGRTLYFSYPLLVRGRRTSFDVEKALGVRGTFRTARVAATLFARMSDRST
jgi:hypothetical protein